MSTIAELVAKLTLDNSSFVNGIEESQSKLKGLSTSVSEGMKNVGGGMMKTGGMITAAAIPITMFFKSAISGASDLTEQVAKTDQVFKESSKDIHDWSKGITESFGIAIGEAYEYAGNYGNLFTNMGLADDMAADYSISLVELAADQAAFNNLPTVDVLGKIQSGMTGMYKSLKSLGINLNAAMVEEKAFELGLADANDEISQSALMQARYALILEQSSNAIGQTGRESEGLAFQQKKLAAEFKNLKDELGLKLIPIVLKVVGFISGLIDKFSGLSPTVKNVILVVGGLFAVLGPILVIVGSLVFAIGTLIPVFAAVAGFIAGAVAPILIVVAVIAVLIAGVVLLRKAWASNWGGIQDKVKSVTNFIQGIVNVFRKVLGGDFRGAGEDLRNIVINTWGKIKETIKDLLDKIQTFFKEVDWIQLGKDIINGIVRGILDTANWLYNTMGDVIGGIVDFTEGLLGIGSRSKVFFDMAKEVVAGFAEGLSVDANIGVQRAPSNSMKLYGPVTFAVSGELSVEDLLRQLI